MPLSRTARRPSMTLVHRCKRVLISARPILTRLSRPFAKQARRLLVVSPNISLPGSEAGSARRPEAQAVTRQAVRSIRARRLLAIRPHQATRLRLLAWESPVLVSCHRQASHQPARHSRRRLLHIHRRHRRMDKHRQRPRRTLRHLQGSHQLRPTTALHHRASVRRLLLSVLRPPAIARQVLPSVALGGICHLRRRPLQSTRLLLLAGLQQARRRIHRLLPTLPVHRLRLAGQRLRATVRLRRLTVPRKFGLV